MSWENNKFYDLKIGLWQNGRVVYERAAVRSIKEKKGIYYFDIFLYRWQKLSTYDQGFIQDIYDELTGKKYTEMQDFLDDYIGKTDSGKTSQEDLTKRINDSRDILKPLWNELCLMLFMARLDIDNEQLKESVIYDYLQSHLIEPEKVTIAYVRKYLNKVKLSVDDFYQSLAYLKDQNPDKIAEIYRTVMRICLSDGRLHYIERLYLAEIVQFFRLQNINLL